MKPAHVVLGALVRPNGAPSDALMRRALTGAQAVLSKQATILILSGGGVPSEAAVAADIVEARGVPASRLRLEEDARNTVENIAHAWALAWDEGYHGLVLITDRTHLPRALLIARILGVPATGLAAEDSGYPRDPKAETKAALREVAVTPMSVFRAVRWRLNEMMQRP